MIKTLRDVRVCTFLNQNMIHLQVALLFFFPFYFPLNSKMKYACARLNAPGRCFLIRSIAFYGVQPLLTNANATKKGARPKPARQ
jgi:hypothetical protein